MENREQIDFAREQYMKHDQAAKEALAMVDTFLNTVEFHQRQMDLWNRQIGNMIGSTALSEVPKQERHLRLVKNDQMEIEYER